MSEDFRDCPCNECIIQIICTEMCDDAKPYFLRATKKKNFGYDSNEFNMINIIFDRRNMKIKEREEFLESLMNVKEKILSPDESFKDKLKIWKRVKKIVKRRLHNGK